MTVQLSLHSIYICITLQCMNISTISCYIFMNLKYKLTPYISMVRVILKPLGTRPQGVHNNIAVISYLVYMVTQQYCTNHPALGYNNMAFSWKGGISGKWRITSIAREGRVLKEFKIQRGEGRGGGYLFIKLRVMKNTIPFLDIYIHIRFPTSISGFPP